MTHNPDTDAPPYPFKPVSPGWLLLGTLGTVRHLVGWEYDGGDWRPLVFVEGGLMLADKFYGKRNEEYELRKA